MYFSLLLVYLFLMLNSHGMKKTHGVTGVTYSNSSIPNTPASDQLLIWGLQHPIPPELMSSSGTPVDDLENILTAGPYGPVVLQDYNFFDQFTSFDRERIPERVVHAKGAGAHGFLEVTHDISSYTVAQVFAKVPAKIPVLVRFSRVAGEMGSPDSPRDTRGFAIKFYTSDGIWDLVSNNSPVFFIRDALRFPTLIHSIRRNPQTHLLDPNMMWDFASLVPETTFQQLIQFSDIGLPKGYRHMHGYSINTFTFVNATGQQILVRFHLRTNQGLVSLTEEEAVTLAGTDPDAFIRDLYNAIGSGNYPSWNFSVQLMTFTQAAQFPWNPLDATKLWPETEYPLIPVGVLTLNKNPVSYFAEVEMAAFSPRRLVPGIQPTTDKILQGRLFPYGDSQVYRLGPNYYLETANVPPGSPSYYNYQRDGYARCGDDEGNAVNYFPNSFHGPQPSPRGKTVGYDVEGLLGRYDTTNDDNFSQATIYWNSLNSGQRSRLVMNLAGSISQTYPNIQARALANFNTVSPQLGSMLKEALKQMDGAYSAKPFFSSTSTTTYFSG